MIYALIVLSLACIAAGIVIYNMIRQIESYEEDVINMYTVFEEIRKLSLETQVNLKELDIRGVFEADDEVGVTFKNIKQISDELTEFIDKTKFNLNGALNN